MVLYDPEGKTTRRHTPIDMLLDIVSVIWQWFWNVTKLMGLPLSVIMSRPHESVHEEMIRSPELWVDCRTAVRQIVCYVITVFYYFLLLFFGRVLQ